MRSMAKRRVGGATRASAQKGLLSPIPWAQWRMASLVATSIYGSGRGTALPIRARSDSRASGVMVGNRAVGMRQLWSGLGRRSRRRSIGAGCSPWTRRLLPARLSLPRGGLDRARLLARAREIGAEHLLIVDARLAPGR